MQIEVEENEINQSELPVYANIYIPDTIYLNDGEIQEAEIEFYNLKSLPQITCKDNSIVNVSVNWEDNSTSNNTYDYLYGDVTIKGLKEGETDCYIKYGDNNQSVHLIVEKNENLNFPPSPPTFEENGSDDVLQTPPTPPAID
jgi:hypothetical protein